MAENVNIPLGDGTNFQAPAWATETTLNAILSAIDVLAKTSEADKKALKQIAKDTADGNDVDKDLLAQINASGATQKNLLKEMEEGNKENRTMFSGLKGLFLGLGATIGTLATSAFLLAKGLGEDTRNLDGGLAIDLIDSNAVNFSRNLRTLGISADDIAGKMGAASETIAVLGRNQYMDMTSAIMGLTGAGANFGKSLAEITDALDEDLALQQSAGILQNLNDGLQAKRSANLFEMQLKSTTMLGKSIDDIRNAGRDSITDNGSIQLLLQSMGEAGPKFNTAIQQMTGELSASGVSQGFINAMTNASLETVAFSTDAGTELFNALTILDGNAKDLDITGTIQEINELSKGTPAQVEKAQKLMAGIAPSMREAAQAMSADQIESMRVLLEQAGPLGQQLAISFGQLSQAIPKPGVFNALAVASATLDNSMAMFNGALAGVTGNLTGAFATGITGFLDAFTRGKGDLDENNKEITTGQASIFRTFSNAMMNINDAFTELWKNVNKTGGKFTSFSDMLQKKINPIITAMGTSMATWISSITVENISDYVDSMIYAFRTIAAIGSALYKAFSWTVGLLIDTDSVQKEDADGNPMLDTDGKPIMEDQFDLVGTIVNGLLIATAYATVKKAFGGLFAGGLGLASKIPGVGKLFGQGKAAEATGKSFGKGAAGMLAFGAAAAGVGIALFGISDAMETFKDMSWEEIRKGVVGITVALIPFAVAIGLLAWAGTGPQAIGLWSIAGVLAAIGVAAAGIGVAAGGISMLVDSFSNTAEEDAMLLDNQTTNIKELAEIDAGKLQSTAKGIDAMAVSMVAFGNATNDGWFSGPDISDMDKIINNMQRLATLNGTGLVAFASGMNDLIEAIKELGKLDSDEMLKDAEAVKQLYASTQQGFGSRVMDTVDNVVNKFSGNTATPRPNTATVKPVQLSDANNFKEMAMEGKDVSTALLQQIVINTSKTQKAVVTLTEAST